MCVKAGMFGPWSEMHTSPVARDPKEYKTSNAYNIIHQPIPAGVAHTLNSNDVNSMIIIPLLRKERKARKNTFKCLIGLEN